jgi:subtilisin family serine protease
MSDEKNSSLVSVLISIQIVLLLIIPLITGCAGSGVDLRVKAKIPSHKVLLPTSQNIDVWQKSWDRKTFIVGMSEELNLSSDDALSRSRNIIAGSLIRAVEDRGFFSDSRHVDLQAAVASRLTLERVAMHDDALGVQSDRLDGDERSTRDERSRLSFYFLSVSDVRSALMSLVDAGVSRAQGLAETLTQPAGLKLFMSTVESSWPVEWIEPNLVGYLKPLPSTFPKDSALELAPEFKYNTAIVSVLKRIRADSAFSFVEKSKPKLPAVNVAILDTGVDSSHPELKDQMFVNPSEKADGQDNDNNCYVDDVHGIDATSECGKDSGADPKPGFADLGGPGKPCPRVRADDELSANCGHGSHVAGIIAAKHGGDLSTLGICPSCRILSIRVAERCIQPETAQRRECVKPTGKVDPLTSYEVDGGISDTAQIRALSYLYNLRAPDNSSRLLVNIVNLSLGKYFASRTMSYIIRNLQRKNIVVVAAAGNDGTETPSYPAAYESVVAVCATSEDYAQGAYGRAPFSNFGDWVDICAPGTDIVSTVPGKTSEGGGLFLDKSGTSQATPFVAGAIGYILSFKGNNKSAVQLIQILKSGADSESIYNAGYNRVPGSDQRLYRACYTDTSFCDNLLGAGFLDLDAAIQEKKQSQTNFNFLANQPGGCIVSSVAFRQAVGGPIIYGFGSAPALLGIAYLGLLFFRFCRSKLRGTK